MRSWRSTVIAAVAIPTSVVSTFRMMWALDLTLNSVTMLAVVLMVGVVKHRHDLPFLRSTRGPARCELDTALAPQEFSAYGRLLQET